MNSQSDESASFPSPFLYPYLAHEHADDPVLAARDPNCPYACDPCCASYWYADVDQVLVLN
jgi:hypothetical protein